MKTGIMGGTFDPIHHGHLFLAAEAQHTYQLERVFFIPNKQGPHKAKSTTSAQNRYKMVEAALKGREDFIALDIELNREGISYSIDTIDALKKMYPRDEFYFITGADAILLIETWKRFKEVLTNVKFIAATRAGQRDTLFMKEVKRICTDYNAHIYLLDLLDLEISSSDIRRRVLLGEPITYLLPKIVELMIRDNNFYQTGENFGKF